MKRLLIAAALILCTGTVAYAGQVKFQWDASPSSDVAGYRLYLKDVDTGALTRIGPDVPAPTTVATVDVPEPIGLAKSRVVAKAFDQAGNESAVSNEATKDGTIYTWTDTTPPVPPSLLQVLEQLVSALNRIADRLSK